MRLGASVVWHHSLLLMNSFNKTEAAVFSCRLCFLRAFPFIGLIVHNYDLIDKLLDTLKSCVSKLVNQRQSGNEQRSYYTTLCRDRWQNDLSRTATVCRKPTRLSLFSFVASSGPPSLPGPQVYSQFGVLFLRGCSKMSPRHASLGCYTLMVFWIIDGVLLSFENRVPLTRQGSEQCAIFH